MNELKIKVLKIKEIDKNKDTLKNSLNIYFNELYIKEGATYEQIRVATGIGKSTLSDFFNGLTLPNLDTIIKLSMFFEADLNNIFSDKIMPRTTGMTSKDFDFQISTMLQKFYGFDSDEIIDIQRYINYIRKSHKD